MKKFLIILLLSAVSVCYAAQDVSVVPLEVSHITTVVAVGTSATPLPTTALSGRKVISVQNLDSSTTIYLGNANVTADENSTGGHQLSSQYDTWVGDFANDIIVYGRVASSTANVLVWEVR